MKIWVIEHFSDANGLQNLVPLLRQNGEKVICVDVSKGQELKTIPQGEIIFFGSQELGEQLRSSLQGKFLGHDNFLISKLPKDLPLLNTGDFLSLQEVYFQKEKLFKDNPSGFFIRPNSWKKDFSGQILKPDTFDKDWQRLTFYLQNLDLLVQVSPLQNILAEYRFHLIAGKIVTGSVYAKLGQSVREEIVDLNPFIPFLESLRKSYPDNYSAIDLAETASGIRLIEYNPLSTSAIYASNPQKIIEALK